MYVCGCTYMNEFIQEFHPLFLFHQLSYFSLNFFTFRWWNYNFSPVYCGPFVISVMWICNGVLLQLFVSLLYVVCYLQKDRTTWLFTPLIFFLYWVSFFEVADDSMVSLHLTQVDSNQIEIQGCTKSFTTLLIIFIYRLVLLVHVQSI